MRAIPRRRPKAEALHLRELSKDGIGLPRALSEVSRPNELAKVEETYKGEMKCLERKSSV
jgi:hypothetical protein